MPQLALITPPASEPVTLPEAKKQLRITSTAADVEAHVTRLIKAARQYMEGVDGRGGIVGQAIVTQTLELRLASFPAARTLPLPRPPLQSVTSVKYTDAAGAEQTFDAASYAVDKDQLIGEVRLRAGKSWPSGLADEPDAVRVRYVAGHATVPEDLKAALLLHIGHLYYAAGDDAADLPAAYMALVSAYRIGNWF